MPEWFDPQVIETLRLGLLGRLLLATVLGGLIGLERELSGKPAGLRTNILICVGATLVMEVSRVVAASGVGTVADPGRIAAQVVSGIGFIGAGTILVARGNVIGLTTAATLWVVAAIGLAVGTHAYVEAVGTTLLVALTLVMLGWMEDFLVAQRRNVTLVVVTEPEADLIERLGALFREHNVKARPTEVEKSTARYRVSYEVRGARADRDAAVEGLARTAGVRKIKIV